MHKIFVDGRAEGSPQAVHDALSEEDKDTFNSEAEQQKIGLGEYFESMEYRPGGRCKYIFYFQRGGHL